MPLPTGKVGPYELAELVFPHLKLDDERVKVGPNVGLDASIIELEDRVLVLSSDPITGALKEPGWLSVHVNANDIATMGGKPEWYLANIFLPEKSKRSMIERIVESIENACEELDISLVGGHTEVTPGLERVLISGAMVGEAPKDRWVSSGGARTEDRIIFTKSAAIEGTFILALDKGEELQEELGKDTIERAKKFRRKLSVVEDAFMALDSGEVHAMHDPTEKGLAGGLHELADASKVGFSINSEKIPIAEETEKICEYFEIDPLRTIGSGSLIICAHPKNSGDIVKALNEKGIPAADIGEILGNEERKEMDGKKLEYPTQDELWKVFEG